MTFNKVVVLGVKTAAAKSEESCTQTEEEEKLNIVRLQFYIEPPVGTGPLC